MRISSCNPSMWNVPYFRTSSSRGTYCSNAATIAMAWPAVMSPSRYHFAVRCWARFIMLCPPVCRMIHQHRRTVSHFLQHCANDPTTVGRRDLMIVHLVGQTLTAINHVHVACYAIQWIGLCYAGFHGLSPCGWFGKRRDHIGPAHVLSCDVLLFAFDVQTTIREHLDQLIIGQLIGCPFGFVHVGKTRWGADGRNPRLHFLPHCRVSRF